MKLHAAYLVPPVVCALAGAAWAAGDGKACLGGVVKACVEIGTAVANEEPPVGDVDQLRVDCEKTKDDVSCARWLREQIKAGCRSGKEAACLTLGKTEARVIADETAPTASRADAKRALALLDKSCKADVADACAKLGLVLVFDGKKSDTKRGERLLKRACDLGSAAACNWVPSQPKRLKPGDKSMGPGIVGVLKGDDVPFDQSMKNLAKLGKLLEQNCKLGYADACAELEKPVDPDPAKQKIFTSAELAAKILTLERQAAAGPARNTRANPRKTIAGAESAARTADRKLPPKGESAVRTSDRGLAYSFRCDHTLDEIWDLLRRNSRLKWRKGDSEYRGVYVRSETLRDGLSFIRIFPDGDRFVVGMEYLWGVPDSMPYEEIRAIVDQEILPLVGARDIQRHPGWEG